MQVMSVKKFCEERSGIEILAKSAAFAPASSSGATFFCNFSYPRKKG